ncbi:MULTISPECIES: urea carboxylase-associated family protein [unclassified Mycolicibacterium]|uniref:urea carboxylase-associated family protein n=1 Tax=unclassified Mycolicibacterium TaxID=2636767 RepID=UPI002EDA8217
MGTASTRVIEVAGGHGSAISVHAGDVIRIENPYGTQVVDFWAHDSNNWYEHLGLAQCREVLERIYFHVGDTLISNRYQPMLTIVEDDTGILHDTLIAPCSTAMYEFLGSVPGHRSCTSNYWEALPGVEPKDPPQPWNLFMTAAVGIDGVVTYSRPPLRPGMAVVLKALIDLTVVLSACPDDHYPTNGGDGTPRPVAVKIACGA